MTRGLAEATWLGRRLWSSVGPAFCSAILITIQIFLANARSCRCSKQWSEARMFSNTAKGFHVHPASIPKGGVAADWLRGVFIEERENYSLRRYDDEEWGVMLFLQGRVEIILCYIRAGFP